MTSLRSPRPSGRRSSVAAWAATAALGLAPTAFAGDWYVDAAANCAKGNGSAAKPFCTIDAAVTAASDGDTIHVAAGSYAGFAWLDKSLTLVGTAGAATTVIDPGYFQLTASAAPLVRGFTFRNLIAGPITYYAPGDLTLEECVFELGHGQDLIAVSAGCSLTAERCTFDGAGRISCDGGALTLVDCVVSDVNDDRNEGGGIFARNSTLQLTRTEVTRCEARNYGGGLWVEGGSLDLVDCTISSCKAGRPFPEPQGRGGGVALYGTVATASGTTFDRNETRPDNNTSRTVHGGGCALLNGSSLAFDRCTFTDNVTQNQGGAIWVDSSSSFTAEECTFAGNSANFGGGIAATSPTLTRCVFDGNLATSAPGTYGRSSGGAAACYGVVALTATNCDFIGNESFPGTYGGAGSAGILTEQLTATRCRFVGNVSHGHATAGGGFGGAFVLYDSYPWGGPPALFTDCEIVGNVAEASASDGGFGGGGVIGCARADFVRCTIAGNVADSPAAPPTSGAEGGGLATYQFSPTVPTITLDHTIVAGNFAALGGPDLDGSSGGVTTLDWNCIGDTTDANLTGSGSHDLLDVDPQFFDAANGDFTLAATSPCIDSGDPTILQSGKDVAAFPRLLDGDLDKRLELDRGAHEFSHVRLAITGNATPGGTITVDSRGTIGMATFLIAGFGESELPLKKLGALFVDLTQVNVILAWAPLESSVDVDLDPATPVPLTVYVQELALATRAGNFSNLVRLEIE